MLGPFLALLHGSREVCNNLFWENVNACFHSLILPYSFFSSYRSASSPFSQTCQILSQAITDCNSTAPTIFLVCFGSSLQESFYFVYFSNSLLFRLFLFSCCSKPRPSPVARIRNCLFKLACLKWGMSPGFVNKINYHMWRKLSWKFISLLIPCLNDILVPAIANASGILFLDVF